MELLIVFVVGYVIISIQDWITDMRFYCRRTQRELNRIRRSLGKVTCVKHTLPTGEVEVLGPGKVYFFGGPKTGTITGVVSEEEMLKDLLKKRAIGPLIKRASASWSYRYTNLLVVRK